MKKILLVGNCPLPGEDTPIRPAAGLRTWQFLKPLRELAERGEIRLTSVLIAMPECYEGEIAKGVREESEHYKEWTVGKNDPGLNGFLVDIYNGASEAGAGGSDGRARGGFDAVIAVNTFPSYVAAGLKGRRDARRTGHTEHSEQIGRAISGVPLWCDLNGWGMAEGQAQAYKKGTNDYLPHYYEMEKKVLLAGDKFSTVSLAQSHAVLGELAMLGRVGRESFGYSFTEHVPNGTEWFESETGEASGTQAELAEDQKTDEASRAFEIKNLPQDACALLWLGGYNTWVDEHTLFKGLELAMKKCEKLYFVSTGGAIQGLEDKTFLRFQEMIEGSNYKDRFIFLSWVDTKEIPAIYKRADIGINVDRKCLETTMGARNRINEMMKFGLPVITTAGSEIAEEVRKYEAGLAVKSGDHEELAEAIASMYEEWRGGAERASEKFKKYGENGKKYILEKCNYRVTSAPLFDWLKNPLMAPDRGVRVGGSSGLSGGVMSRTITNLKMALLYLKERGLLASLKKLWQRL